MKQIVLSILIAILYVACAFGEEPVTSPDLTQIRIKENPGETLEYVGKIGNDYDSALDSLRKLKAISSEIIKEPLEVVFDYDDRFFFGIIYDDCGMYSDVLDTEGNYYLRSWYSSEDNTNGIIVPTNPIESLYGEWWLVGWNDKGTWLEVDTNYVSHRHLSIEFKEKDYVMAYSMANEICVGRLTLNGNDMNFGGEMRGGTTKVYVDMMENEFFEDHICDIKSYQLEGNLLRLYYTDDDYFVFSNEYLKPIIPKENDIANYRPFIKDGKVWKVGHFNEETDICNAFYYYYFDGDTIVGGKPCKRMMCRKVIIENLIDDYPFTPESTNYAGAFYEENRQVYIALPNDEEFLLLYDFKSEVGDTIDVHSAHLFNGKKTISGVIVDKGELVIPVYKGNYVKVKVKNPYGDPTEDIENRWLEGVGTDEEPTLGLFLPIAGYSADLFSCTVGDEVLYKNPYFEDLYPDIESGETTPTPTAKRRVDFTHVVKKKPKAPQRRIQESEDVAVSGEYTQTALTIDLGTLQDTYAVTITDPSGQSVYAKDVKTNRVLALDIDISAYNTEDAYTITLENEDEIFEGNFRLSDLTSIHEVTTPRTPSDVYHDLMGRRITTPTKGIYIHNGKKVLVK